MQNRTTAKAQRAQREESHLSFFALFASSRWKSSLVILTLCLSASPLFAGNLTGDIRVHDPSTVIACDGRYWVYSTGAGIVVHSSADGLTWRREPPVFQSIPESVRAASPLNDGSDVWAPDIAKINGQFYLYYAVSSWGSAASAIGLATSPTLTPTDPHYKWTDHGIVIKSVEGQQLNCIDPCIVKAPDGTLWLSYGSYIGVVEVVQLDPATGLRITPDSQRYPLSSASEASAIIHHGDYYYLFVDRGSCCSGRISTYNMRMGRSAKVTGPYLDRYGADMLHGGGSLFLASEGKKVGPGHFGLVMMDGLERFSCHWEADADHGQSSVLDIRPLLWHDGWPVAGDDPADGVYQIRNQRTGYVLGIAGLGAEGTPVKQERYITATSQRWQLKNIGGERYQISGLESGLSLGLSANSVAMRGGDGRQVWSVQQVDDGSFRLITLDGKALTEVGGKGTHPGELDLEPYAASDAQKWLIIKP
jgi:arabinan endo-1,5-alpha-L-arabinosidase